MNTTEDTAAPDVPDVPDVPVEEVERVAEELLEERAETPLTGELAEESQDDVLSMAELRAKHPVFRRRRFFDGRPVNRRGDQLPDIGWFQPDGTAMSVDDWVSGFGKAVAVYLNGDGIPDHDGRGQRVKDDTFFVCFSAHFESIDFTLPPAEYGRQWCVVLDTADPQAGEGDSLAAVGTFSVGPRATVVLRRLAVDPDAPSPLSATTTAETLTEAASVEPGMGDPQALEPSVARRARTTTARRTAGSRRKSPPAKDAGADRSDPQ